MDLTKVLLSGANAALNPSMIQSAVESMVTKAVLQEAQRRPVPTNFRAGATGIINAEGMTPEAKLDMLYRLALTEAIAQ